MGVSVAVVGVGYSRIGITTLLLGKSFISQPLVACISFSQDIYVT